jgi:hypothetical protein
VPAGGVPAVAHGRRIQPEAGQPGVDGEELALARPDAAAEAVVPGAECARRTLGAGHGRGDHGEAWRAPASVTARPSARASSSSDAA